MKDSILLSDKYGVNPSVIQCFVCGGDAGVALMGRLKNDAEAPRTVCTGDLCQKCLDVAKEGVHFICIDTEKTKDVSNPYRTGRLFALKDEAVRRVFEGDVLEQALKKRVAFVADEIYDMLIQPEEEHEQRNGEVSADPSAG